MIQNLQIYTKYEPKSEAVENFTWKCQIFDDFFDLNACDQKLLLVTFYVKSYLVVYAAGQSSHKYLTLCCKCSGTPPCRVCGIIKFTS